MGGRMGGQPLSAVWGLMHWHESGRRNPAPWVYAACFLAASLLMAVAMWPQ